MKKILFLLILLPCVIIAQEDDTKRLEDQTAQMRAEMQEQRKLMKEQRSMIKEQRRAMQESRREMLEQRRAINDKVQSMVIAQVTKELELTSDEATQFWPIHNRIVKRKNELEAQRNVIAHTIAQNVASLDDKAAQEYIKELNAIEEQIDENNKGKNQSDLIKIIGAKRYLIYRKAQHDFRKRLLNRLKRDRK